MIIQRCLVTDYLPNQFVIYTEVCGETFRLFLWPFSSGILVQCLVDTFSRSHGAVKVTFQHWVWHENSRKQGPLCGRGTFLLPWMKTSHVKSILRGSVSLFFHLYGQRDVIPGVWSFCVCWKWFFNSPELKKLLNCLYWKQKLDMNCTVCKGGFFQILCRQVLLSLIWHLQFKFLR